MKKSKFEFFILALILPVILVVTYMIYIMLFYSGLRVADSLPVSISYRHIELHADLYEPAKKQPVNKAIIILHSSNPLARKMPFMQVLATKLAGRLPVLNADIRGFGDSRLVTDVENIEQLDFAADLQQWSEYLQQRYQLESEDIILLGRATGASAVMHYMHRYPHHKHEFVLICPSRGKRVAADIFENERPFLKRRWQEDMPGDHLISPEVLRELAAMIQPANLPQVQNGRPISLFDTPRTMDTDYLQTIYAKLSEPKRMYIASSGVSHYYGTKNYLNKALQRLNYHDLVFYDEQQFNELYQPLSMIIDAKSSKLAGVH